MVILGVLGGEPAICGLVSGGGHSALFISITLFQW